MGYTSGDPRERLKRRQRRHYDCLLRIIEMEWEIYGMILSWSAEKALKDYGLRMHPPYWSVRPPEGRSAPSLPRSVPPPNPGMGVAKECIRKCKDFDDLWGDGQVIARLCPKHGTVRYEPEPPTRPSPVRGERR